MCLSCGYGEPDDDRGDTGHITWTDPRNASGAVDNGPEQAAERHRVRDGRPRHAAFLTPGRFPLSGTAGSRR